MANTTVVIAAGSIGFTGNTLWIIMGPVKAIYLGICSMWGGSPKARRE
ncbi:MAG: hypothetical protein ABSF52_09455 [Syntrophobacteraceae bacterium]|jgi:hypothetical protein